MPADNMGFARCGVEGNLREFVGSTRKKPFHFFCKFEKVKMVFARDWFSSRLSVCSSPHLAKPFPVICNYARQIPKQNISTK